MSHQSTDFTPAPIPSGRREIEGNQYIQNTSGGWDPVETTPAADLLEDEVVRKVMGFAIALSDQVARFKGHAFEDLSEFEALLAQEYGAVKGGPKGNKTFLSHDGCFQIKVAVQDYIDFGPQLQIAKGLMDECVNDWSADARAELRDFVTHAFKTDKSGQINKAEIFRILRRDIKDPRWQEATRAIRDAMRVVGSKTYIRFQRRDTPQGEWQSVTIDLAKA